MPDTFMPRWVQIFYGKSIVGGCDHIVAKGGESGEGWHTLCCTWWADGPRTNAGNWRVVESFGDRPRCRKCRRMVKRIADAVAPKDALENR